MELETGQNGTLTPYPGKGVGQTWLGADGATITFEQGVLKASRGMGDDVMGSTSSMPSWSVLLNSEQYVRQITYLTGNNFLQNKTFKCVIKKVTENDVQEIWGIVHKTKKYKEDCVNPNTKFSNVYYVDKLGVVRRSKQYHSDTLGYIITERIESP